MALDQTRPASHALSSGVRTLEFRLTSAKKRSMGIRSPKIRSTLQSTDKTARHNFMTGALLDVASFSQLVARAIAAWFPEALEIHRKAVVKLLETRLTGEAQT